MSSASTHRDASLSAATFLASISAESSTAFEPGTSASAPTSAPALPISAKVSLIDAQIDALESRIEKEVTTHAAELRARAASTRAVDRDLNRLWLSINQTSSQLVTVGPQLAPKAIEYQHALAHSSRQALLLSVLSDLLAATRLLERLEKLQRQPDLPALRSELPMIAQVMRPFQSKPALQSMPSIIELKKRFDRLQTLSTQTNETSARSSEDPQQSPGRDSAQYASAHSGAAQSVADVKEAADPEQALTPALKVLDAARALIIAPGPDAGWKEVRIERDAPALPPSGGAAIQPPARSTTTQSTGESKRTPPETPISLLAREDLTPESTSLTRNSSSSSSAAAASARSRHKPKLGARLIRPQDQLGNGPFNAEDAEEDGWGLDDDDDEQPATAIPLDDSMNAAQSPQSALSFSHHVHQGVAALARDDHHSSPSSSVMMQPSMSSSSSQRSAFAIQGPETHTDASIAEVDAWGLGEDDVGNDHQQPDEAEAWDLDDDDEVVEAPSSNPEAKSPATASPSKAAAPARRVAVEATRHLEAPILAKAPVASAAIVDAPSLKSEAQTVTMAEPFKVPAASDAPAAQDAWSLEDDHDAEDDPWETEEQPEPSMDDSAEPLPEAAIPDALSVDTSSTFLPTPVAAPKQVHDSVPQAFVEPVSPAVREPEADAWGFEEGSSASEADQAELKPALSMRPKTLASDKTDKESARDELTSESGAEVAGLLGQDDDTGALVESRLGAASPEVEQVERSSSPSGWGDDFSSDADSTGLADEQPLHATMLGKNVSSNDRIAEESRSSRQVSDAQSTPGSQNAKESFEATSDQPVAQKEACTISQRSRDLVALAESTMDSVIGLLRESDATSGDADDAEALSGTIYKIFELHRALMPVAHGEVLRDVPALAMQFFNDSEYLARELTRLVAEKGQEISAAWLTRDAEAGTRWSSKELVKLEQEAALTRALGQRWFEAQMTTQSKILLDTLMEADGFARTFDEQRFGRCERCIKQVVQTLQQLAKAWRPVLVASRFHAAMGRLVDLVFQKVLHDVLDLEDIGESESEKIASLVKTLGSLESVFGAEGGQPSTAPLWVPSWFKTSYLIEILMGSLVDIDFLAFEAGALVDYSRRELTGLVKALFADTPKRSRLLQKIESASVDVLAH